VEKIVAGIQKFRRREYASHREFYMQLASKPQKPLALFITCADSRIHPNLITQTEPGELFLLRNAGNIVPPYGASIGGEAATIEYSVEVLSIRHIILCGHSQCGAIKALLEGQGLEHLPAVRKWCGHAEATRRIVREKYSGLPPEQLAVAAAQENVLVQVNNLSTHPSVAARLASGELNIYGWYYDIGAGEILQYDRKQGRFCEMNGAACDARPLPTMDRMAAQSALTY
jgi:carbonic anhydrase